MTLQEAIDHCKEKATEQERNGCLECGIENMSLLVWLEELQQLREFKRKIVKALNE